VIEIDDLERRAREVLDPGVYDYYAGGAGDEITLAENAAAWSAVRLRPHVLRDVSAVSTSIDLLGTELALPVLVPPLGYQRLAHDRGEVAMAEGAAAAGSLVCVSTMATMSMEEVAEATEGPKWFQLYVHADRDLTKDLILRAKAAGYRAIVFTVDLPVLPKRKRDVRNAFALPEGMELANMGIAGGGGPGSSLQTYADASFDPALSPADIAWIGEVSGLPVVVKGILRGDDAMLAVDAGAAGVIVSNHGGRQLDTVLPTAVALPEVLDAVAQTVPVLVDGGLRSGTDIMKALAMGASAVLVGRPLLWALAVGGAQGVAELLNQLRDELSRSMALAGATTMADLDRDFLRE
jgi:isopentenyl diphosphate isomerase/L-lactate dehydrogenase-like FMN-dependent dehydrogenase